MAEVPPVHSRGDEQLRRIYEATGCKTQVDLAALFGIRQSSVSIVRRQNKIPDKWLVQLSLMGINLGWVLTGKGPRYLPELPEQEEGKADDRRPPDRVIIRNLLYCFSLDDLRAELRRRRASPANEGE